MQFRKALPLLQAGGQIYRRSWGAQAHIDVPHENPKTIVMVDEHGKFEYKPEPIDLLAGDWESWPPEAPSAAGVPVTNREQLTMQEIEKAAMKEVEAKDEPEPVVVRKSKRVSKKSKTSKVKA